MDRFDRSWETEWVSVTMSKHGCGSGSGNADSGMDAVSPKPHRAYALHWRRVLALE